MMMEEPTGGRTGGVYIPPFKLAMMKKQKEASDPASPENQKLSWEALRKSINGLINKVNVSNIKHIVPELFQENLIRGRGLFARAVMKAQLASPGFTHIYASLVAVINTKLPENGELILKRVIYGFKRAYKRRDKLTATALARFIAHLVNHQVSHEILALQLLTVLLEEPTDDSVEIAVGFVKEVGQILEELSPQGLHFVFERFRGILHEGDIDKRVQYTIEGLFAVRKSGFKDYPAIPKELDLVEREDQVTFEIGLDDDIDKEEMLDIFRVDPDFAENEKLWEDIKKEILGDDEDDEEDEEQDGDEGEEYQGGNDGGAGGAQGGAMVPAGGAPVVDLTEGELINLRRSIYLTIMSSVSYEECCHKLIKLNIPEGYESELANMLVECCSNERSYIRYYGLMGQRFCMIHRKYQGAFDEVFLTQYNTIHRLETNKLRNVAKFFAHLLCTDALPWTCMEYIKLNEYDTTSSSRIFIKILVQDLAENLGLAVLKERFSDPYMQDVFSGLFPTDTARNTRFAINFFTSIGLGSLTDGLREHLKNAPKILALQMQEQMLQQEKLKALKADSSSSSSSSSDSDSSSSSSSSDSDSDSSSSSSSGSSNASSSGSSSESDSGSSSSSSSGPSSSSSSGSSAPARKSRSANGKKSPSPAGQKGTLNEKVKSQSSVSRSPPRFRGRRGDPEPRRGRSSSLSRSPPRRGVGGGVTEGAAMAAARRPPSRSPSPSPPRRSARSPSPSPPRRAAPQRSPSRSPSPPRRAAPQVASRSASPEPVRKTTTATRGRSPSRSVSRSSVRRQASNADASSSDEEPRRPPPRRRSPSSSASPPRRRADSSPDAGRRSSAEAQPRRNHSPSPRRDGNRRRGASRSPRRDSRRRRASPSPYRGGGGRRGGRDSRDRTRRSRTPPRRRGESPRRDNRDGWVRGDNRDRGRDTGRRNRDDSRDRQPARRRSPSRSDDEDAQNKRRRTSSP